MSRPTTIDEYIAMAPDQARGMLLELLAILKQAAPTATESIKWGHPVLQGKRILFSFRAHKDHINFMPTGPSLVPFEKELKDYKTGKDTVQFTYDKPLPVELIKKIAEFRVHDVNENGALWMY